MLTKAKNSYELIGRYLGRLPENEISHMLRVGILVRTLSSKLMGIDCSKSYLLGEAACYHDVGKIHIPQPLLQKRGNLTVIEWNLMKMHCVHGQIILNQISKYDSFVKEHLWLITEAALFHHERWDGGGYPFNLSKKQIPILSRLVSICDAYDAMTTIRPYSSRKSHQQACDEIERCAGIHFDPELVNIFINNNSVMEFCVSERESDWYQPVNICQRM